MPIGVKVTLRRERMYEFLDRLITVALPRVRDFRGVSPKSFDGRGNYTLGLKEQIVFPEIDYDKVDQVRGMDIVIVHDRQDRRRSQGPAQGFDMPFRTEGRGDRPMAKKSAIEKNNRAPKLAKQHAAARRRLKAVARDRTAAARGALRRAAEAGPAAAQQLADPHPQPLRADRPSARLLPQVQAVAHRAARTWPRPGQIPGMVKSSW